ncbi:HAMP domain-containing protein [Nostoc sp.]|uniref:HAMP domain-containing protein n=1 Tax=Nostoc sp. TaxID=1180 RepID=UPI002FFC5C13
MYRTFSSFILRWIIQPVLALQKSALALTQDEWEKTIKINRSDELGELAKSFNICIDITERKKVDKILTDYNSILEQQVAKRTLELQREIAERKQVEVALLESEARFRLLAEATFEAIACQRNLKY